MRKLSIAVLSLAAVLFAASCASSTYAKVKSETVNPQFRGAAGKRVLVLVATSDAMREDIENQFAIEGVARDVAVTPSHRFLPDYAAVTPDKLSEVVKANAFDRVLVVRNIPGATKSGAHAEVSDSYRPMGETSAFDPGMYKGMYNDVSSTVVVSLSGTTPPQSLGAYRSLTVEARLYDSTSDALVWDQTAEITTSRQKGESIASYVRMVLKSLRGKGLL